MMKRTVAILIVLVSLLTSSVALGASYSPGDLIKFIPTRLTVTNNSIKVEGYFVNMNSGMKVRNFYQYKMKLYHNGTLLASGDFGTLSKFTVPAMGVRSHSFIFNGRNSLKNGTIICDDNYYCVITKCRFTTVR